MASNLFTTNKMRLEKKSWLQRNFKAVAGAAMLCIAGFGAYNYMQPSQPSDMTVREANGTQVKPVEATKALPAFANSLKPSIAGLQGKVTPEGKHSKGRESLKISKSGHPKGQKIASYKKQKGQKIASYKKQKGQKIASYKKQKGQKIASNKKQKGHKFTSYKKHKGHKIASYKKQKGHKFTSHKKHEKHQRGQVSTRKKHPNDYSQAAINDDKLFDL